VGDDLSKLEWGWVVHGSGDDDDLIGCDSRGTSMFGGRVGAERGPPPVSPSSTLLVVILGNTVLVPAELPLDGCRPSAWACTYASTSACDEK
jgi:hypothetical protein